MEMEAAVISTGHAALMRRRAVVISWHACGHNWTLDLGAVARVAVVCCQAVLAVLVAFALLVFTMDSSFPLPLKCISCYVLVRLVVDALWLAFGKLGLV